jgi:hypothetical protein
MWCKSLESVAFENGSRLERIEESAFQGSGLKSILIPSSVVVLGKESFWGCNCLEFLTFKSGSRLERIEESTFRGSRLKSIVVPGSVTFIDRSAFDGISVSSISVSRDNGRYRLHGCFLEDFGALTIHRCFDACSTVMIPWSVEILGERSFSGCRSLELVTFESGSRLERIDKSMFEGSGVSFGKVSQEFTRSKNCPA